MKYIIIGSTTSPYVRRLRAYLHGLDCEFKSMMVFDPKDRQELLKISPILKIPVLKIEQGNDESYLYESRVIFNYINKNHFKLESS